ncbi:sulfotransferase [Alteromonas stellipolaris]|uniref:sulfotransferase n=1 Tax=Alteromonas stellipolaris TaxID=233316 RepID=UPI0021178914|nr:sulfotransferase [Alteromonas stellipolaris]MCQ8847653.1 sulfotransferase [Alteromonas stellipolaris]
MSAIYDHALTLFNEGKLNDAITLCKMRDTDDFDSGMLHAKSLFELNEEAEAQSLLSKLIVQFPTQAEIPLCAGTLQQSAGYAEDAISLFKQALAIDTQCVPAMVSLADCLKKQGKIGLAIKHYFDAFNYDPTNEDCLLKLADALIETGQFYECIQLLQPRLTAENLDLRGKIVVALYHLRFYSEASHFYSSFINAKELPFELAFYAALCEVDEKRFVTASSLFWTANKRGPKARELSILANLAFCELMLHRGDALLNDVIQNFATTIANEDACFIANMLEANSDISRALEVLRRAENQSNELVLLTHAKLARRLGDLEKADVFLAQLERKDPHSDDVFYERLKWHDASKDYDKVVKKLSEKSRLAIRNSSANQNSFVTAFKWDVKSANADASALPLNLTAPPKVELPSFVFIVGFPRSGTTLLESKLAEFSQCTIMEETHFIKRHYQRLSARLKGAPVVPWLVQQSPEVIDDLRVSMIEDLSAYIASAPSEQIIVDKMPFNGLYLAFIAALFPTANIIWLDRDPADICISCLKQREINLVCVDDFIAVYNDYISLRSRWRSLLESQITFVRYEKLVSDYDEVFKGVVSMLSLNSSKTHSETRIYNTPSYAQVKGITHTNSIGLQDKYLGLFTEKQALKLDELRLAIK